MSKVFHIYTSEELDNPTPLSLDFNWDPSNYLTIAYASDTNVGVSETRILSFENKLCALHYFRNFLDDIKQKCRSENISKKMSEIDNSINSITITKTDKNIDLQIVNFESDNISIGTDYSGYWKDVSKAILKEISDDIDCFFDFQYDDETEDDYSITLNSNGLTTSLRKIQAHCRELFEYNDINDQFFIKRFYELCQSMNQFWDEL